MTPRLSSGNVGKIGDGGAQPTMPRLRIVYRRPPVEAHSVERTDEDNEPPHDSSNDTEATNTPAQMAPAQIGHDQVEGMCDKLPFVHFYIISNIKANNIMQRKFRISSRTSTP
jgi:hypothetical protein